MSGNHSRAVWEDVTDTTPMTIHLNETGDEEDMAPQQQQVEISAVIDNETIGVNRQRSKHRRKPRGDERVAKSGESPRSAKSSSSAVSTSSGFVQFTTLVSASFWLVDCPNWMRSDMLQLVDQLYKVLFLFKLASKTLYSTNDV